MNDSGESNFSGNFSHVPSQPAVIPSPRSMVSCDPSLQLDTWNLFGTQGNVFGCPRSMFDSSQTSYQGILQSTNPKCHRCNPSAGEYRETCRER